MLKSSLLILVEKAATRELDLITFAEEYGEFTFKALAQIKEDKDYEALKDLKSSTVNGAMEAIPVAGAPPLLLPD